jgi:hypothetical protein
MRNRERTNERSRRTMAIVGIIIIAAVIASMVASAIITAPR